MPRLHFAIAVLAAAFAVLTLRAEEAVYGQIKAAQVIGNVEAIDDADHTVTPLHNNDALNHGYTIRTGAQSSVVLVFSNGATVRLGDKTEIDIEQFVQDPFAESELAIDKLTHEPSASSTRLKLTQGEIVGEVPKLHSGSTHIIDTPVGAAGIRGTTFRHVYRVAPNGTAQFSSGCGEGEVTFTDKDGKVVPLPAGRELSGHRNRRGRVQVSTHALTRRSQVVIEHHLKVMRTIKARVKFQRKDAQPAKAKKPALKRDPEAKKETYNDFSEIDREEQERMRQEEKEPAEPKPAPTPKPEPAPKPPKPPRAPTGKK